MKGGTQNQILKARIEKALVEAATSERAGTNENHMDTPIIGGEKGNVKWKQRISLL